ncbi:hypothetical protein ACHWQZ_G012446 [Mnemiopsis leidyi]
MWYCLAFLLLLPYSSQSFPDNFSDINKICVAVDDVLSWAKAHHYLLIVDFMFSIRVAQGELEMLSKDPLAASWSQDVVTHIKLLRNKVDRLAELALSDIQGDDEDEYYKQFERLIEKKYYISSYFAAERRLTSVPRFPAPSGNEPTFSEQQSDGCMREVLGNSDTPVCTISRECFLQMTNRESEDYQLTHQLLYIILAQVRGCSRELDKVAQSHGTSVSSLEDTFTAKILQRLSSVLESGRYDLFTEMVMIGQMLNYKEFYRPKVTELIILWQDTTGCYNDESYAPPDVKNQTNFIGRKLFADEIVDGKF